MLLAITDIDVFTFSVSSSFKAVWTSVATMFPDGVFVIFAAGTPVIVVLATVETLP